MEVGEPDIHTSSSAGPLESDSNAFGIASSIQGIPPLIARQGTGTSSRQAISVAPERRETPPAFVNTTHLASSSSSPALSSKSEERGHEDGSEESTPHGMGGRSERSGISPPMETASISSDPVPSTVEVQLRTTLVRPASTPHSLSKLQCDEVVIHPMAPNHQHNSSQKSRQSVSSLRRGKWTVEEESYVARVIQDFNSGYLNAPAGTTLRSYLSDKLHCDPMRITKKFTGDSCIGKRVFHPAVRCPTNTAFIDKAQAELDALERRWRRRLDMQQREAAKKAAASAAAATAVASCRSHFHPLPSIQSTGVSVTHSVAIPQEAIVTRTASWLDRANTILAAGGENEPTPLQTGDRIQDHAQGGILQPAKEIEDEMIEVQRLIHEGPIIQQTTAGLPRLLDHSLGSDSPLQYTTSLSGDQESSQPPVDKRPRRLSGNDSSGAEDAQALVGFLNSVRAAAAADHPSVV